MKIGLTYDLRREYLDMGFTEEETAEFDSEDTINSLDETLQGLGHDVQRIGSVYKLNSCLCSGERWDLVFNLSEGLYGRSREAQVPALLEAYNIPYTFSDPLTLALSLDKAMTKAIVRDAGAPTPEFFTLNSLSEVNKLNELDIPFPLFVKPRFEGTGKGVSPDSVVRDLNGLKEQAIKLISRYRQPVLVEGFLPGRELTVGILGTGENARVIGVMDVKLNRRAEPIVYSFVNKELSEEKVRYQLVKDKGVIEEAGNIAIKAYRALECRDAGRVDLRADRDGRLSFMETNPLAGLNPSHSDLPILCSKVGITYKDLISEIISSALKRIMGMTVTRPLHSTVKN